MTAAEFERLTSAEVECLLRRRLNRFVGAGATPCAALVLAAQVEIPEEEAVSFLEFGFSVDLTLRLLQLEGDLDGQGDGSRLSSAHVGQTRGWPLRSLL